MEIILLTAIIILAIVVAILARKSIKRDAETKELIRLIQESNKSLKIQIDKLNREFYG